MLSDENDIFDNSNETENDSPTKPVHTGEKTNANNSKTCQKDDNDLLGQSSTSIEELEIY